MTFQDIKKSISDKKLKPIYLLHGDESYYIDELVKSFEREILTEDQKAFNFITFYGKDTDHLQVVDTARRFPVMAPYQVVIIKEAQDMKTLAKLEKYVSNPSPNTVLVIIHKHKKFDKRTKFAKELSKNAVLFESKKLYENKIADWAIQYLKEKDYTLSGNAAELIVEFLGTDLSKIANELDKLLINLKKGTTVTVNHIQDNIGISKDYNVFELQNALGYKKVEKAQRIVNYFNANPKSGPLVMVIASLYNFFSKIYILHFFPNTPDNDLAQNIGLRSAYFLKDYKAAAKNYPKYRTENVINILKEYDLKSKGVNRNNTPESELLKELIYKILHA